MTGETTETYFRLYKGEMSKEGTTRETVSRERVIGVPLGQ